MTIEWTPREDEVLRQAWPTTSVPSMLAQLPGRSASAIYQRARRLALPRKQKHPPFPFRCGATRLIARTCSTCGRFLDAEWFNVNPPSQGGGRSQRCRKCEARRKNATPTHFRPERIQAVREARVASRNRQQAVALAGASRHGYIYTEADLKVLGNSELTLAEKAAALGRSYHAIDSASRRRGLKSKMPGLGELPRSRFTIGLGGAA